MIDWIRKSFRNRIFASVMLITLLPILLSNILLLSYQVRQTGRDQRLSAEEMLTDIASQHPEMHFLVTPIGCGIAGFEPEDIAPLFIAAKNVENISLPEEFWSIIS